MPENTEAPLHAMPPGPGPARTFEFWMAIATVCSVLAVELLIPMDDLATAAQASPPQLNIAVAMHTSALAEPEGNTSKPAAAATGAPTRSNFFTVHLRESLAGDLGTRQPSVNHAG